MRIIADIELLDLNGGQIEIEHNGVKVSFVMSMFKKTSFDISTDVFGYINKYWASLSDGHQSSIFQIYADIAEDFDCLMNKDLLRTSLIEKVTGLMGLHDLQAMENWIRLESDIVIPSTFEEKFVRDVDKNTTEDKTYTRNDYFQLLTMSLALRVMVPIWGTYIKSIRSDTGNQFKEMQAFLLLKNTQIMTCNPMNKLLRYITANMGKDNFNANNTLNFISSEDFPHWLLSLVCVKRLCIGDIRSLDPKANLTTLIYNFIIQRIRFTDNDFANMVQSKSAVDFGAEGENKISTLERFRINANISLGQIVEMENSMLDIRKIAAKLCVELDPAVLERSLLTSKALENHRLLSPQTTLLRWVFRAVISPRGVMYLPAPTVVAALGALEAILWCKGYHYLALLATSHVLIEDGVQRVSQVPSKMRVPDELTAELAKVFPYRRLIQNRKTGDKEVCLVSESIDSMANDLGDFTWRSTCHEDMLLQVLQSPARRIPILPNIKTELTRLIVQIGKGQF